jgi:hypothetical protein
MSSLPPPDVRSAAAHFVEADLLPRLDLHDPAFVDDDPTEP